MITSITHLCGLGGTVNMPARLRKNPNFTSFVDCLFLSTKLEESDVRGD